MSTNNENPLAAAVRAAYRSLPEKHRATLLKRACPLHPNTTYSILHAAHIPATFQPERISHWLRPDQQQKIEAVILMPEHEEWFDRLVRAFFIESQKSINEWFLASVEKGGQKQLTFDEALAEVPRHFPNDPFVNLYIAGIRWVCSDGMKSHDELVLKEREQATAAPTTGPADVPPSTTHDARPPKSNPQALLPDKLSQFDQGLQQLTDAIAALRNLQPCDCDKLITTTKATRKLADELTSELNQLAADSKHPAPAWSSRDEFCAAWTSVAAAKANQQADREKCQQFKSSVAKLLETATIKVRVPSLLPSRLAMSSSAATEIRNSLLALPDLLQGGPAEPAAWLKWLWSLEGEAADKLHTNLQSNLPELAKLTVVVDWDELQWPSAAKENSLTAPSPSPAPVPTGPPVVTTPAPLAATQPAKLLAKDQATQPSAPKAPTQPIVQPTVPSPVASDAAAPASSNAPKPATPPTKTPISQPSSRPTSTLPVASPTSAPVKQAVPVASTNTPVPQPVSLPPRVPTPAAPPQPSPAPAKPAPVAVAAVQPKAPSTQPPVQSQPDQSQSLFDTVWKLARQGRWGLASHIASLHPEASLPPAWAFEAAELGPRVNYEISPLSERLGDLFLLSGDFSIENIPSSKQPAVRLLIAGAALRPALLAPQTGAASLLKLASINATVRLSGFGALIDAAAEFGLHRQPLQPHMLRSTHNRADWEQQLVRVREDIKAWVEKAPKSHFSFAPALRIWLAWTGTNGALTSLLNRTANATVADLAELTKAWAKWSNAPADQVQSAMKAIGQWKPIDGVHRDKLIARLQEAIDLANRMLAVLSQSPQVGSDFREEKILHQLDVVRQNLKPAAAELRELSTNASEDIQAAAGLCLGTLDHLASLFTGSLPLPGAEEPKPCWLVDAELLRDTSFPLNSDGVLLPPTPTHLGRLVVLSRTVPDWMTAWQSQVAAENHAATAALLEVFRWQLPAGLDPVALATQRDRDLDNCRKKLEQRAEATRRLLDESTSLGFCRENDFLKWSRDVTAVQDSIANASDILLLNAELDKISQEIHNERNQETAKVRKRAVTANLLPTVLDRITALLDVGDIHTATDYLDHATQGHALPDVTTTNALFDSFFSESGWLRRAESALREAPLNDGWIAAGTGNTWNFLNFQLLGLDQRATAEAHLRLWHNLERSRRASENDVLQLASAFGLQPIKATSRPTLTGPHAVQPYVVQAQLVDDRSTAVVPAFGSDTRGRYTIHFVWGEPRADELLSLCRRETGDTSAHIIVAFRVLNTMERRELAEVARKPERAFKGIVVDRALFAFACAQPTGRLSTILRCALPFSCVEPYTVAAGEVAPEMFFGRGQELHSLAEPRGSCFVYGGRQLGKTALLRALERQFHNLPQGRAAVFVDLKRELFSRGRPLDDLWSVLVARLKEVGVLGDIKVGAAAGQEALFRHIKDWLNAAPERRLLLLLDEADSFLESDGKECEHHEPFPRCQRLKGLMEDTKHRFKVIFAGLHNVQRTTRFSNHPLAHFGDAICIGPMLGEAESREARALVEQPMTAAGYNFESPDVVSRILALTNYYPSLIQLFCHHLLLDLRANHGFRFINPRHTPPCVITSQHVQTVYGNTVRKRIHEKVRLTLDLDKRYELIAYFLAYYNSLQSGQDGVEFREIRTEAATYWPAGFTDMRTDDEFRSLLDEMVGLGILRPVKETNRYALRNENVVTLLGTQDEIIRQLDLAKSWDPALKYEADKFRRLLAEKPKLLFSPLTAKQEGELKVDENRVAILYGLPASGLGEVPAAMESDGLFTKSRTIILRHCPDAKTLSERIAEVQRPPGTNTVLIVSTDLHWDETWIAAATHRLALFTSKDAFLTVLFLADPMRTIATLQGMEGAEEQGVRQFTLRPWHDAAVRQWLQDLEIQSDRALRDRIYQATGNWPVLLMRLNTTSAEALNRSCDDLGKLIQNPAHLPELYAAFGFSKETGDEPLRLAAELKQFTPDDVCEFVGASDEVARLRVTSCIKRAEKLGMLSVAAGGLEFDPMVATILLNATRRP